MALDIGERRIGIATSDSGLLATPHSVLHRTTKQKDLARLQRLIEELGVERLIVGLPYSLSGEAPVGTNLGPQGRRIMRFTKALAKNLTIPFEYFDESYSTADAEAMLTASGGPAVPLDAAAAAVILQNYLNASAAPLI